MNIGNYSIVDQEGEVEGNYGIKLYVDKKKNKAVHIVNKKQPVQGVEQAQSIIQEVVRFLEEVNRVSEGFYLVEHILLRQGTDFQGDHDPYSFVMTMVFPSWPARFQSTAFRNYLQEMVLQEAPAHIFVHILWLDLEEMESFEKTYKDWLEERLSHEPDDVHLHNAAKNLLGLIMLYSRQE